MRGGKLSAAAVMAALAFAAPAAAYTPERPWPPAEGPGALFVHYGEEHWNDPDGRTLLPEVVADTVRYAPDMVTMSGDKGNNGKVDELRRWKQIMRPYDEAGVPYFPGVGNHDRLTPLGLPGGATPIGEIENYRRVFADRPYPFGDAQPYDDPELSPKERPAGDPSGAASHYFVDYGNVRWIFLDNSCFGIVNCDFIQAPNGQNPPSPERPNGEVQYLFLEQAAKEADEQGKLVFVVMHMPTRDPGDQTYRAPIALSHTMGKGTTPDNSQFEAAAERVGVDAVLVGHIKGQFQYHGQGDIPYFIDGGAGGELYTTGAVGTDHGYWHGYRLVRVDGDRIETDTVPIIADDGIRIEGPDQLALGERLHLEAFGRQDVHEGVKVDNLELRDPDPRLRSGLLGSGLAEAGRWLLVPVALLLLLGLTARTRLLERGGLAPLALIVALAGASGVGAVALAQRATPTSTLAHHLPTPARIWTSSNPNVLRPVPSEHDDPRRDPASQTDSGEFDAVCPGRSTIEIVSGWEAQRKEVLVPSPAGPIVRSLRRGARRLRSGRAGRVASVLLAQPAQVIVTVKRGHRVVDTVSSACVQAHQAVRWDGRALRAGRRRPVEPGIYTVEVRVRSDRRPVVRRYRTRVR